MKTSVWMGTSGNIFPSGAFLSSALALCSFLLATVAFSQAQVTLNNVKMEVAGAVRSGAATLSGSPLDIGTLGTVFDGDTNSLARTPNINPAYIQVAYMLPRTLTRFRLMPSYGSSYDWWVEKSDNQADMDSRSGSWAVVTPTNNVISWRWGEQSVTPVTASLFRLYVRRYGGDGYCHINEWELYGSVTLDKLEVAPGSASMFFGETRQFQALGFSSAMNESFNVSALVHWSLTGDIGTLTTSGLFTAGNAGQGSVTAAIPPLFSAPANIIVLQSEPDVDVLYIERTPRLSFDPGNTSYTSGLPALGQRVTYLAHVKNWGSRPVRLEYEWWFDGLPHTNGIAHIPAGMKVTVPFDWNWENSNHSLEFRADPSNKLFEISELNNRVKIRSNALLLGLWVEQSLYNYFHEGQAALHDGANSFEDWGQRMVNRWNWLFAKTIFPASPRGFLDRVALDKVTIVPDGALPLAGGLSGNNPDSRDRTVDMQWGYPWDPASTNDGAFYMFRWNGPFYLDFGSIHEMNHARFHIDLYALDENHNSTHQNVPLIDDDTGQLVAGTPKMPFIAWDVVYYNKWRDIMGAGPPVFDAYSAAAWNWKHHLRGQGNQNAPPDLGRFLNDLPLTNHVQFIDQNGVPLAGAQVWLYRTQGGFYTKVFNHTPAASYVTDANGWIHLGRNPFGNLPDFSYSSPLIIFKVRYRGQLYFMFQEVTDFNLQNWLRAGVRQQAAEGFYVREIDLRDNPVPVPDNAWLGNYFSGGNFSEFITSRVEGTAAGFSFEWPGTPVPGVQSTNFTVYWQGGIPFSEGWKQFRLSSDGGVQLFVDGRLVFDQWTNQTLQVWTPIIFTAGNAPFVNPGRSTPYGSRHRVEVRYRHSGPDPARVSLSWTDEPPPAEVPVNAWRADHYSTRTLAGYVLSRVETEINNNYQGGSPDPAIPSDNYSARWTGDWDFPGGSVMFTAVPDDGMRVYIDGARVLDKWFDQPPTTYTFTRSLTPGRHRIVVEYYEGGVTAQAVFTWRTLPWFVAPPADLAVLEGSDALLSATAAGVPAPRYQWLFEKSPLPGAVSSELRLQSVELTDSGTYTLVLSNSVGSVSAAVNLTVIPRAAVPVLASPSVGESGAFEWRLLGLPGWTYQLHASTNLFDWVPVAAFEYTNGPAVVSDPNASNFLHRFYRGVLKAP